MNALTPILSPLRFMWGSEEQNWVIATGRKLNLLAIVLGIVILTWHYPRLPPLVPLWYGKPWGIDRLAHPLWLILLPLGSFIILILNSIAARILAKDMLIFSQILTITSLLVSILSLVTMTKILFLVL